MTATKLLRLLTLWIMIIAAAISLSMCKPAGSGKPALAVSIAPQKYLLERIVGDKYDIVTLLSSNADPESYDPAINSLMGLQKSKVFFRLGSIGFEQAALDKIAENLPDLKIINCSAGIPLITGTHGRGQTYDPHVWSSVRNARIMARNMYDAMVKADPRNEKYFTANYKRLDSSLESLDSTLTGMLASHRGESFVVKHPSLSYFANDYGLIQLPLELDGKEPTPQQMRDRLNSIRNAGAKYMFVEKGQKNTSSAVNLAKELNLKIVEISPLDYDWTRNMLDLARTFVDGEGD